MQKYIGVAFSLKGQNFADIIPALEMIAKENEGAILVHGFMDRDTLAAKELPLEVVDALDKYFPAQLPFFKDGAVDRDGMKNLLYEKEGTVYVIGKIKEGVKDEVLLYVKAGVKIKTIDLGEAETLSLPDGERHYTKAELVNFGEYLLSEERLKAILGDDAELPKRDEKLTQVYDGDVANWETLTEEKAKSAPEATVTSDAGAQQATSTEEGSQANADNVGPGPQASATDENKVVE